MDYYVGEIRIFAGREAPKGWHICDGSLLPISGNEKFFTLITTTYGGDGITNFALPDLRGRVPIGQGQGTNLATRTLGKSGGSETVALTIDETPVHSHTINATSAAGTTNIPENNVAWANSGTVSAYSTVSDALDSTMNAIALSSVGDNLSHNNMMPSIAINFIISLNEEYPELD